MWTQVKMCSDSSSCLRHKDRLSGRWGGGWGVVSGEVVAGAGLLFPADWNDLLVLYLQQERCPGRVRHAALEHLQTAATSASALTSASEVRFLMQSSPSEPPPPHKDPACISIQYTPFSFCSTSSSTFSQNHLQILILLFQLSTHGGRLCPIKTNRKAPYTTALISIVCFP